MVIPLIKLLLIDSHITEKNDNNLSTSPQSLTKTIKHQLAKQSPQKCGIDRAVLSCTIAHEKM
jgi:hypothetical protein